MSSKNRVEVSGGTVQRDGQRLVPYVLCWLGRHDWWLSSVQSRAKGVTIGWVGEVYHCRRCPAKRFEEGNPRLRAEAAEARAEAAERRLREILVAAVSAKYLTSDRMTHP